MLSVERKGWESYYNLLQPVVAFPYFLFYTPSISPVQKQSPEVLGEERVLKKFGNLTRKHMCWSFFLMKLQLWRFQYRYFIVKSTKFLRTCILKNIFERLLPLVADSAIIHYSFCRLEQQKVAYSLRIFWTIRKGRQYMSSN